MKTPPKSPQSSPVKRAKRARMTDSMKTGTELIAEERARQISKEGWNAGHDDGHDEGELAKAAMCYAAPAGIRDDVEYEHRDRKVTWLDGHWPWGREWWKPTPENRVRELVKAGALIAAEIDRLQRLSASVYSAPAGKGRAK